MKHKMLLVSLLFLLLVFSVQGPLLLTNPFEPHAVQALNYGAVTGIRDIFRQPEVSSGLRVVPYTLFVIENWLFGTSFEASHLLNILLISFLGVILWRLFCVFWHDEAFAFLIALCCLLLPPLMKNAYWLTGRQMIIATSFGFLAVLIAADQRFRPWSRSVVIFICLIVAALSKEFGLLFLFVVPVYAYLYRRSTLVTYYLASLSAIALYVFLFFSMIGADLSVPKMDSAGGGMSCEEMAYMFEIRPFCTSTDIASAENVQQILYNVAVGVLAPLFPMAFSQNGTLSSPIFLEPNSLAIGAFIVSAGSVLILLAGAFSNPRRALFFMAIVVLNGMLSFAVFRYRNLVPGYIAAIALLVSGAEWWIDRVSGLIWGRQGGAATGGARPPSATVLEVRGGVLDARVRWAMPVVLKYLAVLLVVVAFGAATARNTVRAAVARASPTSHCAVIGEWEAREGIVIMDSLLARYGRARAACESPASGP